MKKILILFFMLFLYGCSTIPENEEQMIFLLGTELQYHLDNKAWIEKYGEGKEEDKEFKEFPYKDVEKERTHK